MAGLRTRAFLLSRRLLFVAARFSAAFSQWLALSYAYAKTLKPKPTKKKR